MPTVNRSQVAAGITVRVYTPAPYSPLWLTPVSADLDDRPATRPNGEAAAFVVATVAWGNSINRYGLHVDADGVKYRVASHAHWIGLPGATVDRFEVDNGTDHISVHRTLHWAIAATPHQSMDAWTMDHASGAWQTADDQGPRWTIRKASRVEPDLDLARRAVLDAIKARLEDDLPVLTIADGEDTSEDANDAVVEEAWNIFEQLDASPLGAEAATLTAAALTGTTEKTVRAMRHIVEAATDKFPAGADVDYDMPGYVDPDTDTDVVCAEIRDLVDQLAATGAQQ